VHLHRRITGTLIDVSHIAATPIGMRVTAEVRLVAVVGRKLRFLVACRDEREIVGKGNHERTLIRPNSFMRRAESKRVATTGRTRTSTLCSTGEVTHAAIGAARPLRFSLHLPKTWQPLCRTLD
jgi:hypothetical protein